MSAGYVIPVDPAELAARFSSDSQGFDEASLEEAEDVSVDDALEFLSSQDDFESRIAPLLDRIPEREADLIHLYFVKKKRQADIAEIFGVTQAAISYRLDRGIQRIKFLLSIPQVSEEELRADLPEAFPAKVNCPGCKALEKGEDECSVCSGEGSILIDVEILAGMWASTCQSEVASRLKLTQGRVRHRFFNAVRALEQLVQEGNEKLEPYQRIFSAIADKNFNVLKEVKLPQWSSRGGDECI